MQERVIEEHPRTHVLVFQTGDELMAGLQELATQLDLAGASFHAIGACARVELAYFDWEQRRYVTSVDLQEQVELLSLLGDIARDPEGKIAVHAHAVVARRDGRAYGGHLRRAIVRPTCEVVLTESAVRLQKAMDPVSGLPLIRLGG